VGVKCMVGATSVRASNRSGDFELGALCERYALGDSARRALAALIAMFEAEEHENLALGKLRETADQKVEDSLTALGLEEVRGARRMADVGSGLGFPGLPLAAALPQAKVALVEKQAARCQFLDRAVEAMGLTNVEVVGSPVQAWTDGCATCDLVTVRIGAPLGRLFAWAGPLVRLGGWLVVWRGHHDLRAEEATRAAPIAETHGVRLVTIHRASLSGSRPRHLHLFEKIAAKSGSAQQRPLIGPKRDVAISMASLALEWQSHLAPADRDRFRELAQRRGKGVAATLSIDEQEELSRLFQRMGVGKLFREAREMIAHMGDAPDPDPAESQYRPVSNS
jgi:16S rRNA (guanine527-N7)-methyltransferase